MAYDNRPLISIVNKLDLIFEYKDVNANFVFYATTVDVTIESIGQLNSESNLTLIFKFTVPADFPSRTQIDKVENIEVFLFHTDEDTSWPPFLYIRSDNEELVFGKELEAEQEAKIIITIPRLRFDFYTYTQVSNAYYY